MKGSRIEHLTGALSVILFAVGSAVVGIYDFLPPADRVADYFTANSTRVNIGAYLGALGAFFLIWFAGSLRSALREREGARGRLSAVAFGGGVAAAVALAASFTVLSMAAARAGAKGGGIGAQEALVLYDLSTGLSGLMLPISLAVLVGASGVVSLRAAIFPAWFGWVSVLIALGSLSPVGYFAQILAVLWVLVVSLWLYVRGA